MKLASIVPMKNVEETFKGDYAMLLAHLKDYYPARRNKNCYTIMDNSLIELGGAVDVDTVYEAAKQCKVHEFILPDVYRDGIKTAASVVRDIVYLRGTNRIRDFNLMAVCQGGTIREFEGCFKLLADIPEIHCIGIPKVAAELHPSGRPGLEYIWQDCNKAIHLLGCAKNLNELTMYQDPARIRSCDTCIPALLSTRGISDAWTDRPEKTIDLINDEIRWSEYNNIRNQLVDEGLI